MNWEVVTCFSCFEIPMFYVIYVINILIYSSHLAVSGYGIVRTNPELETVVNRCIEKPAKTLLHRNDYLTCPMEKFLFT